MAEYRLSPAAESDLEGIWKYTPAEWGLEQAERYTDSLIEAFKALAESPKTAPGVRSYSLRISPPQCRTAYDLFSHHGLRHCRHSHPA